MEVEYLLRGAAAVDQRIGKHRLEELVFGQRLRCNFDRTAEGRINRCRRGTVITRTHHPRDNQTAAGEIRGGGRGAKIEDYIAHVKTPKQKEAGLFSHSRRRFRGFDGFC